MIADMLMLPGRRALVGVSRWKWQEADELVSNNVSVILVDPREIVI